MGRRVVGVPAGRRLTVRGTMHVSEFPGPAVEIKKIACMAPCTDVSAREPIRWLRTLSLALRLQRQPGAFSMDGCKPTIRTLEI